MRLTLAIAIAAGLTSSAAAQSITRFTFQASKTGDPNDWWSFLDIAPGDHVQVRVRVRLESSLTALGLAGFTFQPSLSNWHAGSDLPLPFSGPTVPSTDWNYLGYMFPGTVTLFDNSNITTFQNDNTLRFAHSQAVTMTANLTWGLAINQGPRPLNPTGFDTRLDVIAFKFGFVVGTQVTPGQIMSTDATNPSLLNNRAAWFTQDNGLNSIQASAVWEHASMAVVPALPTLAPIAGLACIATRRRRSRGP